MHVALIVARSPMHVYNSPFSHIINVLSVSMDRKVVGHIDSHVIYRDKSLLLFIIIIIIVALPSSSPSTAGAYKADGAAGRRQKRQGGGGGQALYQFLH